MGIPFRTTLRILIMNLLRFLPQEKQIRIERRLRGREDARKLSLAPIRRRFVRQERADLAAGDDVAILPGPAQLSERNLIAFDNLHNKVPASPADFLHP